MLISKITRLVQAGRVGNQGSFSLHNNRQTYLTHLPMPRHRNVSPLRRMAASSDDEQNVGRTSFEVDRESLLPRTTDLITNGQPSSINTSKVGTADHSHEPIDWIMTSLLFLFPAIGGALFGYDIGATSGALLSMTNSELSGTDWYSMNAFQSGLVVSLSLFGALLGSIIALIYGDKLGRKRELLIAASLYGTSSLAMLVAPSLAGVQAARLLYGVGIGLAMHAAPAYIAETSPPRVRGLLISLKEAFIVGGILSGYATSYLFVEQVGGWRGMYGAAAVPAVVLALGMAWLPESPRWLLLSGSGPAAAVDALRRTKGSVGTERMIQAEIDDIETAMINSPRDPNQGVLDFGELLKPRYRQPLTIGVSLMLFQQITGQPSVLYYAAKIFQAAGFESAGQATGISIVLGTFKLVMTSFAVATVDSWGRRPLLLTGVAGIIVALCTLSAVQGGMIPLPEGTAAWTNLGALLLYVGAYQMSFGPISWLIVGEVFPLRVRGQAIALATLTNFASNFGVSLILPSIQETYGQSATYVVFAVIGVAALVTINSIVPETKGKSLEEIEALWRTDGSNVNTAAVNRDE